MTAPAIFCTINQPFAPAHNCIFCMWLDSLPHHLWQNKSKQLPFCKLLQGFGITISSIGTTTGKARESVPFLKFVYYPVYNSVIVTWQMHSHYRSSPLPQLFNIVELLVFKPLSPFCQVSSTKSWQHLVACWLHCLSVALWKMVPKVGPFLTAR